MDRNVQYVVAAFRVQLPVHDIEDVISNRRGQSFQMFKLIWSSSETRASSKAQRQNDTHTMQTDDTVTGNLGMSPVRFHTS